MMMQTTLTWENIPEPLLTRILSFLSIGDVARVSLVCNRWYGISQDNSLWRRLFRRKFKPKKLRIRNSDVTWKEEYCRLVERTPTVCVQELTLHKDEVLHVAFSTSGKEFVTNSKDATLKIWRMDEQYFRAELEHEESMRRFYWRYTWASKFNETDTLLLVAGVVSDLNGEIAIFRKNEEKEDGAYRPAYSILSRVINNPYDVVGDWASSNHFFSGRLVSSGNLLGGFSSSLYLCQVEETAASNTSAPAASSVPRNEVLRLDRLRCLQVTDRSQFQDDTVFMTRIHSRQDRVIESEEQTADPACREVLTNRRMCLIFLSARESLAPHQVGFCLVQPADLDRVPCISEPDYVINLHGHIVGLCLSQDQRYLYVNVRPWPPNSSPSLLESPPIASEIEMRVVDLQTLQLTQDIYTGHRGFTDSMDAFYIYIDLSSSLVCSGSEDSIGRLWDRYYGCKVGELQHGQCVNACAFSPRNPEVLVSVSDDNLVKVWHSRALVRQVGDQTK